MEGDFVKGKMEEGESTHETAVRETKEETGITDVKFVDNFEEWIEYNFQYQKELVDYRQTPSLEREKSMGKIERKLS